MKKRTEDSSIAGSEGSGGNAKESGPPRRPEIRALPGQEQESATRPDDTMGSVDGSGSGLPRGGTLPDAPTK